MYVLHLLRLGSRNAKIFKSDRKLRAIKRYLIKEVVDGEYETNKGQLRPEKVCSPPRLE